MSLQNFVKQRDRAGSPQNAQSGQRINPDRQAIAANAKVSMKKAPSAQQPQQELPSVIPSRGLGNAQNSSAAMQHAPQRRHSGQGQKHDPYDTDAESIDTTMNQSVIQVEESEARDLNHQQHSGNIDPDEEFDEDDEVSDEGEDGEDEYDDYALTHEDVRYLEEQNLGHVSRHEAIAFLRETRPHVFRTIDGDSYPTTTEGDPNE